MCLEAHILYHPAITKFMILKKYTIFYDNETT